MTPILAAFWHRTRREFVAMTADDLSVKTKRHHDLIVADMRKMQADGSVIASSYSEKGKTIYELPPKMQALVQAQVIGGAA